MRQFVEVAIPGHTKKVALIVLLSLNQMFGLVQLV